MATLREAVEQSPVGRASNPSQAWGYASIVGALRLPDGRIEVTVYELEGAYTTATYAAPRRQTVRSSPRRAWSGTELTSGKRR